MPLRMRVHPVSHPDLTAELTELSVALLDFYGLRWDERGLLNPLWEN